MTSSTSENPYLAGLRLAGKKVVVVGARQRRATPAAHC